MRRAPIRFAHTPAGLAVAYAASGQGPVLVRASHWMTHVEHDARSPIWAPWIERLSRTLRLVRYDAIGTGRSDDPGARPLTFEDQRASLTATVAALETPTVALLGPSHGAAAALQYAADHPERVTRLVILGGFARGLVPSDAPAAALEYHEALARLIELGWGTRNPALRRMLISRMAPGASAEQAEALAELQRQSASASRAAELFRMMSTVDVESSLSRVRCPTLVLHSARDASVPFDHGRALAAQLADAQLVTLDSDSHLPLPGEAAFEHACSLIEEFVQGRAHAPSVVDTLTARERELARLMAAGMDNVQLASALGVADKTVRNAVSSLYRKLGVEGRPGAIVLLREAGLRSDEG